MPTRTVPQELIDDIISWLPRVERAGQVVRYTSLRSSCAAALTSRSWLAPAQRNLYRTVDIPVYTKRPYAGPRSLNVLLDTVSRIGMYMKEIVWVFTGEEDQDDCIEPVVGDLYQRLADLSANYAILHHIECSMAMSPCEAAFLEDAIARTPDLTRHFRGASWVMPTPPYRTESFGEIPKEIMSLIKSMNSLQTVSLYGVYTDHTKASILGQTALAHSLAVLTICNWEVTGRYALFNVTIVSGYINGMWDIDDFHTPDQRINALVPPSLTQYHFAHSRPQNLNTTGGDVVLQWLAHHSVPLRNLDLVDAHDSVTTAVIFHRTLRSLTVRDIHEAKDLSRFTALTEMSLHNISGQMSVRQMTKTLDSVRSSSLDCLKLSFFEPPEDDWELLRTTLEHPPFRRLRDLCISTTLSEWDQGESERRRELRVLAHLPGFRFQSF